MTRIWSLTTPLARDGAAKAVKTAPEGFVATLGPPTRTAAQNAAMWPILEAFARSVKVDLGNGPENVTEEDWKDILTATFQGEAGRVAHWQGRVILLGAKTSKMTTERFSEWLEFLHAAAALHEVVVYRDDE